MPEYDRFNTTNKDRTAKSHRNANKRTRRRNWLKKRNNFKISNDPLDNRI